jgi:ABC-type sugar transport system ATPase subunit
MIDDTCVYSASEGISVAPRERKVGMVFQNYALYPHMTVAKNVGFGLRNQKVKKALITDRVGDALKLVNLEGLQDRLPKELSGGQQQRVAVARMLVSRPRIFLFDEPLSNLDPKLRVSLRAELRRMHDSLGVTSIYVTHDQAEAMILGDRIIVMNNGSVEQSGSPREIYHAPRTLFVAQFTGNPKTNLVEGSVRRVGTEMALAPKLNPRASVPIQGFPEVSHGQDVVLNIRPEDVVLEPTPTPSDLRFEVYAALNSGPETLVYLRSLDAETSREDQIVLRAKSSEHLELRRQDEVAVRFRRGNVYDRDTKQIVDSFGYTRHPEMITGAT